MIPWALVKIILQHGVGKHSAVPCVDLVSCYAKPFCRAAAKVKFTLPNICNLHINQKIWLSPKSTFLKNYLEKLMFHFLKTSLDQIAPSRLNSKPAFSSSLPKTEYRHFLAVHMISQKEATYISLGNETVLFSMCHTWIVSQTKLILLTILLIARWYSLPVLCDCYISREKVRLYKNSLFALYGHAPAQNHIRFSRNVPAKIRWP